MKRPLAAGLALYLAILMTGVKRGVIAAVVAAAAAALLLCAAKRLGRERFTVAALALFGGIYFSFYANTVYLPSLAMDGTEITFRGRVEEITDYYGDIHIARVDAMLPNTDVSVFFEGDELTVGDRVRIRGVASSTVEKAENGWLPVWYRSTNNLLEVRRPEILWRREGGAPVTAVMARWRQYVSARLPEGLPRALLLSDRSALEPGDVAAFERVGLAHMLAFSGTHFMILTMLLQRLLALLGLDRRRAAGITLLFVAAVILFMGFRLSVVRSGLMAVVTCCGALLRRRPDPLTSLLAAAGVICIAAPYAVESTALLLSFFSVLGIVLLADALTIPLENKFLSFLASAAAVTVAATVGSAAVTLLIFGELPLLSVPANLLTFVPMSILLAAAPFAGGVVGGAISDYCLWVVRRLAALPDTLVYRNNRYVWLVLAGWLAIYLLCLLYKKRASRPAALGAAAAMLALAFVFYSPPSTDPLRIAMVDVGQGMSVILSDGGQTLVYDCGSSSLSDAGQRVAYQLGAMGLKEVDYLVLSHDDYDHTSGVGELMELVPVECVYVGSSGEFPWLDTVEVTGELSLPLGACTVTLTTSHWQGLDRLGVDSSNDRSLVLMARRGESSALLTGDLSGIGEWCLMDSGFDIEADLLQIGHHGSASSAMTPFLESVHPEICLIPVGKNTYGHPSAATVSRAMAVSDYVYRTDESGTLELATSGDGVFTVKAGRGG